MRRVRGCALVVRLARRYVSRMELRWDASGLVTVVVQDRLSGEMRMVAYVNQEALDQTLRTGFAHFFSRSRQRLWKKGESSGNLLEVSEIWIDCDGDALLYLVDPSGPTCHTGRRTCFFNALHGAPARDALAAPIETRLEEALLVRRTAHSGSSYTRSLLDGGPQVLRKKVQEEAAEFGEALERETDERVIAEAADVLYHLMVGLIVRGRSMRDVHAELARRFGVSGHEEKASRGER